jgi:hypothetical protein
VLSKFPDEEYPVPTRRRRRSQFPGCASGGGILDPDPLGWIEGPKRSALSAGREPQYSWREII